MASGTDGGTDGGRGWEDVRVSAYRGLVDNRGQPTRSHERRESAQSLGKYDKRLLVVSEWWVDWERKKSNSTR